jgi:hypothetical protein
MYPIDPNVPKRVRVGFRKVGGENGLKTARFSVFVQMHWQRVHFFDNVTIEKGCSIP